jgi:hypothetical protein
MGVHPKTLTNEAPINNFWQTEIMLIPDTVHSIFHVRTWPLVSVREGGIDWITVAIPTNQECTVSTASCINKHGVLAINYGGELRFHPIEKLKSKVVGSGCGGLKFFLCCNVVVRIILQKTAPEYLDDGSVTTVSITSDCADATELRNFYSIT